MTPTLTELLAKADLKLPLRVDGIYIFDADEKVIVGASGVMDARAAFIVEAVNALATPPASPEPVCPWCGVVTPYSGSWKVSERHCCACDNPFRWTRQTTYRTEKIL